MAGLVFSSLDMHEGNPDVGGGSVQGNSSAHSVAEQVAEADAIVRVKVDKAHPSRALVISLPPGTRREELKADVIPFTDSGVRVEDVYKGSVTRGANVTIMQTGGMLTATDQYTAQNVKLADDPLFVKGGDHILFLKSITGDPLHAPNRGLFRRVVNPAARYDVHGETLVTHISPVQGNPADHVGTNPATILAALAELGIELAPTGTSRAELLYPVPGEAYRMDPATVKSDERLYIHRYTSAIAASGQATRIQGDHRLPDAIDWVNWPHFFRCDHLAAII